jgi:hypothetical protein
VPTTDSCAAAKDILFDHVDGGGGRRPRHGQASKPTGCGLWGEVRARSDWLLQRNGIGPYSCLYRRLLVRAFRQVLLGLLSEAW